MTTAHCAREDCRHNEGGQCKKTDIIINAAGCACFSEKPPERDRTEGGGNDS